jgi:hypothetical protein
VAYYDLLNFQHFILILAKMLISKIIARGILSAAKSFLPSATVVARPKYCFSKLENIKHFKKVLDEEIK